MSNLNESVSTIVDALYTNFLLRDLFAKIVPGGLVLAALTGGQAQDFHELGFWIWLFLAGVAWVTGFAIQSLGEWLGFVGMFPDRHSDRKDRYRIRRRFFDEASESERHQVERYAIIKEATGNGATGFLLTAIVLILTAATRGDLRTLLGEQWVSVFVLVTFVLALRRANQLHGEKEYDFILGVIETGDGSSLEEHIDE